MSFFLLIVPYGNFFSLVLIRNTLHDDTVLVSILGTLKPFRFQTHPSEPLRCWKPNSDLMTSPSSIPHYDYTLEELHWVPAFIDEVRDFFFARPQDNLLILRPNKTMSLNETAMRMLKMLLDNVLLEEIVNHFIDAGGERQMVIKSLGQRKQSHQDRLVFVLKIT